MKLSAYVYKPDHSLNPSEVGADDRCELGKWLKGDGHKHADLPEYAELVSKHAVFHKAAAAVIEKADRGEKVDDEIALGSASPFASASSAVVSALMKMNTKV